LLIEIKEKLIQRTLDIVTFDRRSIAFVRLLLGFLLAHTFINHAIYAQVLLSDEGIFPRSMSLGVTQRERFSLFLANGSVFFQQLLLCLGAFAGVCLSLNIYPRAMIFCAWILFYSLTFRITECSFGLYPAMLGALFWAFFIPWARVPTVPLSSARDPIVCAQNLNEEKIFSWATLGLFVLAASISFGAGIAKFKNYDFWIASGDALRFNSSYYANVNPVTEFLNKIPYFSPLMGIVVVFVELLAPFLLLLPFKRGYVIGPSLFVIGVVYVSITISIHVGIFPLIPLLGFALFIPRDFWVWLETKKIVRRVTQLIERICYICTLSYHAMHSVIARVVPLCLALACTAFTFVCITSYFSGPLPWAITNFVEQVRPRVFSFFELRSNWGWIYGGPMSNRFMVVGLKSDRSSLLRNMTAVDYRVFFYDYLMNYSNSILRNQEDSLRLVNYSRYLCKQDYFSSQGRQVQIVELYEIADKDNRLRALSRDDQSALAKALEQRAPFFSYDCQKQSSAGRGMAAQLSTERIHGLSAVDLPLLGWRQDFGALRLDRAVDGAFISIRGQVFARGFGTHANSEIRINVKGSREFEASVGLDDEKSKSTYGSAVAIVLADGKEIFHSPVLTIKSPPLKIKLPIVGVQELTLITKDAGEGLGNNYICDDHFSWGDPRVRN
jgi:hypothetical protein